MTDVAATLAVIKKHRKGGGTKVSLTVWDRAPQWRTSSHESRDFPAASRESVVAANGGPRSRTD